MRRPNQKVRKPYQKRQRQSSSSFEPESSSDSDEPTPLLDTWMESSESETEVCIAILDHLYNYCIDISAA